MTYKFTRVSLGWSEGTGLFSNLIQSLDSGKYSHVYLKFEIDGAPDLIYESHYRGGVQITPYCQIQNAIVIGKVRSVFEKELTTDPEEMMKIWEQSTKLHGSSYDKNQIIRYFIWIKYLRRKGTKIVTSFVNGKYTCNEFVITACKTVLKAFDKIDFSYTPEGLFRNFMGEPSK